MTIAPCMILALAAVQPPAAPAQPPLDWRTLEAGVLKEPVQITSRDRFVKAGEAYFSHWTTVFTGNDGRFTITTSKGPTGTWVQVEFEGNGAYCRPYPTFNRP